MFLVCCTKKNLAALFKISETISPQVLAHLWLQFTYVPQHPDIKPRLAVFLPLLSQGRHMHTSYKLPRHNKVKMRRLGAVVSVCSLRTEDRGFDQDVRKVQTLHLLFIIH
jgi:hypothetical protein